MASYERQVRAAQREAEIEHWAELNRQLVALGRVHGRYFLPAEPPQPAAPEPVDQRAIQKRHRREQLAGVSFFKRQERKAAKERAAQLVEEEIAAERARRQAEAEQAQRDLDAAWEALCANEPEHVFAAIEAAYEDNEVPAAPIDVTGSQATLLLRMPTVEELIPERMVGFTPTGRPTHKKRTKRDTNALYAEVMASQALATMREAFAVAPGLQEARLLIVRGDRVGGSTALTPLYAGRFERGAFAQIPVDADAVNPLSVIEEAEGLIRYKGQAQELVALDLRDEAELRAVIDELAAQLDWLSPEQAKSRRV